jgi:hypothetical protein
LNTSDNIQPSGAINLSKFKSVELEINTIVPPFDITSTNQTLCDGNGNIIGVLNRTPLYTHTYDLYLTEERYNVLRFIGGSAGLVYAR